MTNQERTTEKTLHEIRLLRDSLVKNEISWVDFEKKVTELTEGKE